MKKIKFILLSLVAIALCSSCDDKFENIEIEGSSAAPTSLEASVIKSDSLPGQVLLKWAIPTDSNYDYVQIKYYDPLTKQQVSKIASVYTDSILIDNTRHRFGEYSFTFQTFNAHHQGGKVTTVKAFSGVAPSVVTVTKSKVILTASQLSADDPEPTEGPIKNLIDGDVSTFFHTRWSSPQKPLPQYIQIDFNEQHQNFVFYYQNRNGSQVGPREVQIQVSSDGLNWETLQTISSGLPSGSKAEYTSDLIKSDIKFAHFRFTVTKTYGDVKYFNLAEFAFYDAQINVYDPETVALP